MNKFEQYFNEYEIITKSESILIKEGLQSLNATKEKPIIFKKISLLLILIILIQIQNRLQ